MEPPETATTEVSKVGVRSSMIESLKGFSFSGVRIRKEELRRKIIMPEYLRLAMKDAILSKDIDAGKRHYDVIKSSHDVAAAAAAPEAPLVVFINSKSGGRLGPELKDLLQDLMSEEQVFDVLKVKPHEFIEYGLGCLEKFASFGDNCAKETRERLRIVLSKAQGAVKALEKQGPR